MDNISTEIGKIYCKYIEEKDDFDKVRLDKVDTSEEKNKYTISILDDNYKSSEKKELSEEEFNEIKKTYTLLKSDGIISCTNIVAATMNNGTEVKDVLLIYYPNNKITGEPDIYNPYVVARQGINNIFAEIAGVHGEVGLSVSLDTLPTDYALIDFMANDAVLSSHLTHVYKVDTPDTISERIDNEETSKILKDLFEHQVNFNKNTIVDYEYEEKENDCLSGYCNSVNRLIRETGFYEDVMNCIGIILVDFDMKYNTPLDLDDKLFISTLCGGIKIDKMVPIQFDYDIDMSSIRMKYILAKDSKDILWILPYTESPDEIDATSLYNLTEERTKQIQERLKKCVRAYDESIGIEPISLSDFQGK